MPRLLHQFIDGQSVQLVTDANASMVLPPAVDAVALVDTLWNESCGAAPEFDLEMWADGTRALTAAIVYGGHLHPLTFADITVTVDNTTDIFAAVAHGRQTGDGPVRLTTTGTFPGGADGATDYYVVEGADADHFRLAPTRTDALNATNLLDVSSNGTGTIKLTTSGASSATQRVTWHQHGKLGLDADGAVNLTSREGYVVRCRHTPRAFAYAVAATFGAGSGKVSIRLFPIREK